MTWVVSRRRSLRRIGVIAVAAIGVVALVACDPVLHPTFTVKEAPDAPVTFDVLSGDGRFVVVHATGAGATVPGAGCWRVNRSDASAVALPACNRGLRISADGSRILLDTSSGNVLWSGTTLTPPAGTVFSKDLTFGVFVDTHGSVKTWKSADQSIGLVESNFPRPAGTTGAQAKAISNDGRKVEYKLLSTNSIERFVDLDTATKVDVPNPGPGSGFETVIDTFALAASGAGFVHAHEESHIDQINFPPTIVIDTSWAELVAFPSGRVIRRYTNSTQEGIARLSIGDSGGTAWVYRERIVEDGAPGAPPDCQDIPGVHSCVASSHAIAVINVGATVFDTGTHSVASMNSYGDGRFLVFDKFLNPYIAAGPSGPVQILDWATHTVETLSNAATYTETDPEICNAFGKPAPCIAKGASANGQMSNDLRIVATTTWTGKGWYEYTTSP